MTTAINGWEALKQRTADKTEREALSMARLLSEQLGKAEDNANKTSPEIPPPAQCADIGQDADFRRIGGPDSTDLDRAEYLAKQFNGRFRFVEGIGWLGFDGRVWGDADGEAGTVRQAVHAVSNELLLAATKNAGGLAIITAAKAFRSANKITSALNELQAMRGIRTAAQRLDANPWLLTFRNGTVDLRTGELKPHDPEDLITRLVDVEYDPEADQSEWLAFLESSQPDPEVREFLRLLTGYGITGETTGECMAFFYGSGRNGKGVFTETLAHVFKAITTSQEPEFWEKTRYGTRSGALVAKLHGARLVLSAEMTSARLDEAFVKSFVAADLMTANPKYKAPYDFTPTALLIMSGNEKPTIYGTDDGVWRRFRMVPWDVSFVGREDPTLKQRMKAAAAGVAAWAVSGAVDWYQGGQHLPEPLSITEATADYRDESDPYIDWIMENLKKDDNGFVSNSDVFERAKDARVPGSKRAIGDSVVRHLEAKRGSRKSDGVTKRGLVGVSWRQECRF